MSKRAMSDADKQEKVAFGSIIGSIVIEYEHDSSI